MTVPNTAPATRPPTTMMACANPDTHRKLCTLNTRANAAMVFSPPDMRPIPQNLRKRREAHAVSGHADLVQHHFRQGEACGGACVSVANRRGHQ
jgi:hypothetical protein